MSTSNGQNGQMALPAKPGTYQLKRLREVHHNILRLAATGMTAVDIAKVLQVSEPMVRYTINSELGQQKLKVLQGAADSKTISILSEMQELSPLALAVVEEIMLSSGAKDADRLKAAETVLNGAGHGSRKQIDLNVKHLTDDDIRAAREEARKKGRLLDVPITEAKIVEESDDD